MKKSKLPPHLPHRLRAALTNLRDLSLTELALVQILQDFLGFGFVQEFMVGLSGVFGAAQFATLHNINDSPHLCSLAYIVFLHFIE